MHKPQTRLFQERMDVPTKRRISFFWSTTISILAHARGVSFHVVCTQSSPVLLSIVIICCSHAPSSGGSMIVFAKMFDETRQGDVTRES